MSQSHSPFKFLDSYQQADADVFFGREKETNDLYNALSGVKHLLVYGPSGSGKTSLIECGLRNQFSDADWFAITIRKGSDINASVFASVNKALNDKIEIDPVTKMPVDPQMEFVQAIEILFAERYQPVYLLFDQFEELLISGDAEEKKKFFSLLNKLIRNKVPCRIMLIMREEFIGNLSEFEPLCPSIFQYRFRVEKMGRKNVEEVIYHILEAPKYRAFFNVDDSQKLAESILSKLPDKRKEIELAHVQVFLGELWDRAQNTKKNDQLPVLNADLIHDDDNLEAVLESFLKKQMTELEESYGERVPLELLAAMISERFTKLQLSEAALQKDLEHKKVVSKKPITDLLKELEQRRIIRTVKMGDEIQYEISHDVLALVVGQNLTEEMKLREKAGDIYKVFSERLGLFTQDDIDYLRLFQQSLSCPAELQARIDESIAAIKKQQDMEKIRTRKRLRTLYGLLAGALVALIVAVILGVFTNQAKVEARLSAKKALEEKQNATKARDDLVRTAKERVSDLVRFAWIDLDHTGKGGLTDRFADGVDCQTWLNEGFRYLYCKVRRVVSFEKVQSIAGVKIFLHGGPHDKGLNLNDSNQFGRYNPQFLTWLNDYIIPQDRGDTLFKKLCDNVYINNIGPVARALYHSHEILFADPETYHAFEQRYKTVGNDYLKSQPKEVRFGGEPIAFATIKSDYQKALEQGKPVGWGSEEDIGEKFRWLSDYLTTVSNDDWFLTNNAGGFWVRRSIDGTEAQIFQLLIKLLKTFEPEVLSAGNH